MQAGAPLIGRLYGRWLVFELTGQQADVRIKLGVLRPELLDLLEGVDLRGVSPPVVVPAYLRQRARRQLLLQIQLYLPGAGDLAGSPGARHLGLADAVVIRDAGLDLVDRDAALVGAQDVGQHLGDE